MYDFSATRSGMMGMKTRSFGFALRLGCLFKKAYGVAIVESIFLGLRLYKSSRLPHRLDICDAHCELQIWVANTQVLSERLKLKSLLANPILSLYKSSRGLNTTVVRFSDSRLAIVGFHLRTQSLSFCRCQNHGNLPKTKAKYPCHSLLKSTTTPIPAHLFKTHSP